MTKTKRILSIILTLATLVSVISVGMISTKAADYEYAMFPMTTLNITQGINGGFSHQGTLAIDNAGKDSGIESAYAPFTGTITKIYNKFQVWLQSKNPVVWADGTVEYMTILVVHDNDTSDLYVGKEIKQGERFFEEGTAGYATGNHIHLEVAKGKMTKSAWHKNSYGIWTIDNPVNPFDALFLSSTTNVKNDYGYNWRYLDQTALNPFYGKTPENFGNDFYATMNNINSYMYVVSKNQNVEIASAFDVEGMSHYWHFVRQPDGSYVIYNLDDGNVLDVTGAETVSGTNVGTYPYWEHDAQKWFIYKIAEGQYAFKPKLCNLALDVYGAGTASGTNIQLYEYNGSSAQLFSLDILPAVTSAGLEVTAGDHKTHTGFTFSANEYAHTYTLTINSGEKGNVSLYKTLEIKNTSHYEKLPAGYYEAFVEATNGYSSAKSETVSFKVAAEPQTNADGWTYSEKLYNEVTPDNYEIQYLNNYDIVASSAPDSSFTKGEFEKTEYVNSGEAYWSAIELPTSDTLALVTYYYYHYCGGGTGNNANFAATNSYVHYDSISADKVNVYASKTDYDDSRYTYYHLKYKDGSDAYCNSSTTCDGSHGSHGNRSYYWYKNSQYQPKTKTDLYHFTKSSGWTTEKDENATEVSYRYKLKESVTLPTEPKPTNPPETTIPTTPDTTPEEPTTSPGVNLFMRGDVNNDGKLNIRDATLIQKYIAKMVTVNDINLLAADFNLDSRINIKDATNIQKTIAGII
ncbi:MAG: RICIN domain-containing protein [Clostridia bacterium]|nr:RICIN domain-containing protein [Clostridia bacterium]